MELHSYVCIVAIWYGVTVAIWYGVTYVCIANYILEFKLPNDVLVLLKIFMILYIQYMLIKIKHLSLVSYTT